MQNALLYLRENRQRHYFLLLARLNECLDIRLVTLLGHIFGQHVELPLHIRRLENQLLIASFLLVVDMA
jgi:hypothetical protein